MRVSSKNKTQFNIPTCILNDHLSYHTIEKWNTKYSLFVISLNILYFQFLFSFFFIARHKCKRIVL